MTETAGKEMALTAARRLFDRMVERPSMSPLHEMQGVMGAILMALEEEKQTAQGSPASSPITESPTTGSGWGAGESTTPTTPPSSQLDQQGIASGPAEQGSGCVHDWGILSQKFLTAVYERGLNLMIQCSHCDASMELERIPAQAAEPTTLISPKQESPSSVELEQEGAASSSAPSPEHEHEWVHPDLERENARLRGLVKEATDRLVTTVVSPYDPRRSDKHCYACRAVSGFVEGRLLHAPDCIVQRADELKEG